MKIGGKDIHVSGGVIRIARLAAERYEFLEDPEAGVQALRDCGTRIDIFTFIQKLSNTSPAHCYPMEWDNLAALPVSSFDHWLKRQISPSARNKVRRAEAKGVVVREVAFDDALVQGISAIYDECQIGRAHV